DPAPDGLRSEPSVHQAGVHVREVEPDRESAGQRRFAAPGRAVDRDDLESGHATISTEAPAARSASTNPGKLTSAASTPSTSHTPSAAPPAPAQATASR